MSFANRWQHLVDRDVDVVILGDTHTVEREMEEVRACHFDYAITMPSVCLMGCLPRLAPQDVYGIRFHLQ